MKVVRFEIQIDELDNVFREIEIRSSQAFKELSDAILAAFGIKATRGTSFFTSNNKWQKLNEITLGKPSKFEKPIDGLKSSIEKVSKDCDRFIFFCEDVPQFTFLMAAEEKESKADPKKFPRLVKSEGNLPPPPSKKRFVDNIFADEFRMQTGDSLDDSDREQLNPDTSSEP